MQTLRAFEAAARHASYSDAAAELNLTHGAISHRIRELEQRLNVRLFTRVGRSMMPTREAVTLLAQVRHAIGVLHAAFPEPAKRSSAKLVVGVHPAFATRWLVPRMGRFTAVYRRISVEVRSTADLQDFLGPGIDIAVRYGAGSWPDVMSERVADEVLFPVCAPDYKARLHIDHPTDLANCTLLRHAWQPWSPWMRAAGLAFREPTGGLTLSDTAMLLEAAASGQGVALARALFAYDDLANGKLVRLFETEVPDTNAYFMVWRTGDTLTQAAETFRGWLRAELTNQTPVIAPPANPPGGARSNSAHTRVALVKETPSARRKVAT